MRWLVLVVGIVDLYLKYLSMSGENAVINLGVSGGLMVPEWMVGLGLIGIMYWYLRESSLWLLMVLVGGVVNVVSRVIWGGVVDYWSLFGVLHNNLADYLIVGGVVVMLLTPREPTNSDFVE